MEGRLPLVGNKAYVVKEGMYILPTPVLLGMEERRAATPPHPHSSVSISMALTGK